jgi:hypothetical protein
MHHEGYDIHRSDFSRDVGGNGERQVGLSPREDIGAYGGAFKATKGFLDHFGEERVIDSVLSEAAILGAATGAALVGMRPIAEMQFADFVTADLISWLSMPRRFTIGGSYRFQWSSGFPRELTSMADLIILQVLKRGSFTSRV